MIATLSQLLGGPFWWAGLVLLGGAALLTRFAKQPCLRVRLCDLGLCAMSAWLVFAVVPLPRWLAAPTASPPAAHLPEGPTPTFLATTVPRPDDPLVLPLTASSLSFEPPVAGSATGSSSPATTLPSDDAPPLLAGAAAVTTPALTIANAWFAALIAAGAALALGCAALLWVLLRSRPAPDWVRAECATLARRLGLDLTPRIRIRAKARSPFCCPGSIVMLPATLLEDCDALRAILAHELAHLAARDPLRKALGAMLGSVLLLHPAYWLLRRAHHRATEELADARATTALGGRTSRYARPLIELCARMGRPDPLAIAPPGAVGALGGRSAFTRRMRMLLTHDPKTTTPQCNGRQRNASAVAMAAVLALTAAAWGTPAELQDPQAQPAPDSTPQDTLQKRLDRKVSPSFQRCSLEEALKFVAHSLGDPIVTDQQVLDAAIEIESLRLPAMPLRRLLDTLSAIHGLHWTATDDAIRLRFAEDSGQAGSSRSLGARRGASTRPPEFSARDKNASKAALTLMEKGDYAAALALISEERIGQHPGMAILRARILRQKGDLPGAATAYRRAVELHPGYGDAWTALGRTYFQLGEHAKAEQALARAIELTGGDSTSYGIYSVTLSRLGKHEAAGHAVRMAKLLEPETGQLDTHAAATAMRSGRMDEAIAILDRMIRKEPDRAELWRSRARVFLTMDDQDRATRSLDVAVALDPENGDALCDLADLHVNRGQHEQALTTYRRALALEGNNQTAERVLRGARMLAAKAPANEKVRELLMQIMARANPTDHKSQTEAGLHLGVALQAEGRYEASADAFRQALRVDPTNARLLLALAQTKRKLGQSEEAEALLRRAQKDPGSAAAALAQRASIYMGRGDYAKAELLVRQSIEIEPSQSMQRLLEQLEKVRKKKQ